MQKLLLLHGAIGTMDQLFQLQHELRPHFEVYCFNFPGHGGVKMPDSFSIPAFAEATVDFIQQHQLSDVSVFGYSMGGYVAMYTEHQYPGTFKKIATLGTKYKWTEEIAAKETKMLLPDIIEQKVPAFAAQLANKHGADQWKEVLHKTAALLSNLGVTPLLNSDILKKIDCPSLLMLGEKDTMVTLEETIATVNDLPNSTLSILPATPHPIEQVNTSLLAEKLIRFLLDH